MNTNKKIKKATYYECPYCGLTHHTLELAERCVEKHTTEWGDVKYAFNYTSNGYGGAYGYVEILGMNNKRVHVKKLSNGDEATVKIEDVCKVHKGNVEEEISYLEIDIERKKLLLEKMKDVLKSIPNK